MRVTTATGEERIWQYYNQVIEELGQEPYVLGHAVDVTDRRKLEAFLREQAFTDSLTHAANRSAGPRRASRKSPPERCQRRGGATMLE